MRSKKIKGSKVIYSLLIVLILAVAVALYFYLLNPEMEKRDSLRDKYNYQITHLEELTEDVEVARKKLEKAGTEDEMALKIPQSDEMQNVMDDLDEVQASSSATITEMILNNYKVESPKDEVNSLPSNSALTEAELLEPQTTGVPTSPIAKMEKPNNLQLLTLQLSVSAYEANDINQFIKKISELPRIYIVDSVKYTNPDVADGVVTATIQVTTFNVTKVEAATKEKEETEDSKESEPTKKEESDAEKSKVDKTEEANGAG